MARGRNGAPKKPGTSSSMDKGRVREFMLELARVFPSQKRKTGLIAEYCNYKGFFLGALPTPPLCVLITSGGYICSI